jgi:hypothetical protein
MTAASLMGVLRQSLLPLTTWMLMLPWTQTLRTGLQRRCAYSILAHSATALAVNENHKRGTLQKKRSVSSAVEENGTPPKKKKKKSLDREAAEKPVKKKKKKSMETV